MSIISRIRQANEERKELNKLRSEISKRERAKYEVRAKKIKRQSVIDWERKKYRQKEKALKQKLAGGSFSRRTASAIGKGVMEGYFGTASEIRKGLRKANKGGHGRQRIRTNILEPLQSSTARSNTTRKVTKRKRKRRTYSNNYGVFGIDFI